jgi:hypothetical protein
MNPASGTQANSSGQSNMMEDTTTTIYIRNYTQVAADFLHKTAINLQLKLLENYGTEQAIDLATTIARFAWHIENCRTQVCMRINVESGVPILRSRNNADCGAYYSPKQLRYIGVSMSQGSKTSG